MGDNEIGNRAGTGLSAGEKLKVFTEESLRWTTSQLRIKAMGAFSRRDVPERDTRNAVWKDPG